MNSALLNRILAALAWAGVFVAGVIAARHYMNLQLPCGHSQDCEKVAMHASSFWFGIPVALFGVIAYLALALMAFWRGWKGLASTRNLLTAGAVLSAVGVIASVWLTGYSIAVIKATCAWCLASAIIMLVNGLFYAILLQSMSDEQKERPSPSNVDLMLTGCLAVLCIGLIGWRVSTLQGAALHSAKLVEGGLQGTPLMKIVRDEAHLRGPKDAPVTVIEFADFYCPTCRTGYPKLREMFMNSNGKMRMAYKHYPLWDKPGHELSLPAAVVAEYAATKGKYWQFVDAMFDAKLEAVSTRDGLLSVAVRVGLDQTEILKKIQDKNDPLLAEVMADLDMANSLGVQGTPVYLIYAAGIKPHASTPGTLEADLQNPPYSDLLNPGGPIAPPQ